MPQSYLDIQGLNENYIKDKGVLAKEIKMISINNLLEPDGNFIKKITKSIIDNTENIMKKDQEDFTNNGFVLTDKTKKLLLKSVKIFDKSHRALTALNIQELDKCHHCRMHFKIFTGYEFKTTADYYKSIYKEAILRNETFSKFKSIVTILDNKYIVAILFTNESMTSSYPKILNVFVVSSENPYDIRAYTLFSQIEYNEFWFEPIK